MRKHFNCVTLTNLLKLFMRIQVLRKLSQLQAIFYINVEVNLSLFHDKGH